nr:hypothetical protein [Ligilactobacillus ruminis]
MKQPPVCLQYLVFPAVAVVSNKLAQHSAGWQTCEQACYNSTLTVWFAD